jgi:hypothetical protein
MPSEWHYTMTMYVIRGLQFAVIHDWSVINTVHNAICGKYEQKKKTVNCVKLSVWLIAEKVLEWLLWKELASWAVCIAADVSKVTVQSDLNICNDWIYFVLYGSIWKYLNCDVMWGVLWLTYTLIPTPCQKMWRKYRLLWSAGQKLTDLAFVYDVLL